jgi:cytochrome c1
MRLLLGLLISVVCAVEAAPQAAQASRPAKVSLTGCVDEQDGQYVLTTDTDLQPVARLKPAAGSAEDNFAQHMGHKVTVAGPLAKEQPLPVLTVESVKTVSKTCAPSAESQKQ